MSISYKGKMYYAPYEVKERHNVAKPTLYNWHRQGKIEVLNLKEACEGTPFKPEDLGHSVYVEEQSLLKNLEVCRQRQALSAEAARRKASYENSEL